MSELLAGAVGLMFVFEGVLPFVNPGAWRGLLERAARLRDGQIRLLGLGSLVLGVAVLLFCGP